MAYPARNMVFDRVGDYQILSEIGAGGMGVVFKAFDHKLQRTVALKFLSVDRGTHTREGSRLLHEARAASALDHENIATIYAVETADDGRLFIVMAFYEGQSLDARLRSGPMSIREALNVLVQIAKGLSYAHARHVVHGDIKPSNVILTDDGMVKIVDFGLSRKVGKDAATQTVSFAGTLPYLSPEQARGGVVSQHTDMWSLGVLAFQLFSRRLPFDGESPAATLNAILNSNPPSIQGVPAELNAILAKALAKNVNLRYQSCDELQRDLTAIEVNASANTSDTFIVPEPVSRFHWLRRLFARLRWLRPRTLVFAVFLLTALALAPTVYRRLTHQPVAYELYLQGDAKLQRFDVPENLDAAISLFQQTIAKDPNFALAYVGLAEAYRDKYRVEQNTGWLDKASDACKKAFELNDKLPDAYVVHGRILDSQGKSNLALQELQRALTLDRSNAKALLGLADLNTHLGQNKEAEELYRKVIALYPNDWQAFNNFGFYYWGLRQYKEAAEQFRQMTRLIPDSASAHLNLAIMLGHLGDDKEKEAELKRALALGPSYHVYATLGNLYYDQERYPEALDMTTKALSLNGNDYRVWANLALQYDAMGRKEEADKARSSELPTLQKAAMLKQMDPKIQADFAFLLAKLNRPADAKARLEAAIALSPDDPDVLLTIGQAFALLGDRTSAIKFVRNSIVKGFKFDDLASVPEIRPLLADAQVYQALKEASPNSH